MRRHGIGGILGNDGGVTDWITDFDGLIGFRRLELESIAPKKSAPVFLHHMKNIRPFPEIKDIFKGDHAQLGRVFLPLCSVNLSLIDPALDQWVHFIHVWDNSDYELEYFHEYRDQEWIKFKVENDVYSYQGDLSLFPRNEALAEWKKEAINEFEAHKDDYTSRKQGSAYQESIKEEKDSLRRRADYDRYFYVNDQINYQIAKATYLKTHKFVDPRYYTHNFGYVENDFLHNIGGTPELASYNEIPVDKEGNQWMFVGQLTPWEYLGEGADKLFLFFDPKEKVAMQIFEYS